MRKWPGSALVLKSSLQPRPSLLSSPVVDLDHISKRFLFALAAAILFRCFATTAEMTFIRASWVLPGGCQKCKLARVCSGSKKPPLNVVAVEVKQSALRLKAAIKVARKATPDKSPVQQKRVLGIG